MTEDERLSRFFRRVFDKWSGTRYADDCLAAVAEIAAYEWIDVPLGPIRSESLDRWRGGTEHRELCERISWWLTDRGIDWVSDGHPEMHYRGGRADVAARDGSLFVEVGHTPPDRVTAAMTYEQSILLVAFHWDVPSVEAEALWLKIRNSGPAERRRADDERAMQHAATMLRMPGEAAPAARTITCPHCGGVVTLPTPDHGGTR